VLVGDGVQETHLKEMVAALHLNNVIFLGRQPLELMPELFALADVLLGHLKRDPLFTITIPSKTIAYLACGRPIVMAVEGDATDVVREAGAGLCCEPESPRALADAIRRLRDMTVSQRAGLGEAGRDYFRNRFARRILVPQYERLFAEASGVLRQIGDTPEERRGKCSPEDAEPSSGTRQAPRGD
jgi:glycosyltransferase involved in cell wall biosynthesis